MPSEATDRGSAPCEGRARAAGLGRYARSSIPATFEEESLPPSMSESSSEPLAEPARTLDLLAGFVDLGTALFFCAALLEASSAARRVLSI